MEMLPALQFHCKENSLVTPLIKGKFYFIFSYQPEQAEQIVELLVIWDFMTLMWCHFNMTEDKIKLQKYLFPRCTKNFGS